ncbi:hypothetical protein YDYSY3_38400 [Paenibacillus chitinolyticus]|nr:hypothetical protein YDYSY3_38400 [Paenibacillus chitinolyticus]
MSLFRKKNKRENIVKYPVGERVPKNTKVEEIYNKVTRELKASKRKWF